MIGIDHVGSAHDVERLTMLLETAKWRLHADQQALDLDMARPGQADAGALVIGICKTFYRYTSWLALPITDCSEVEEISHFDLKDRRELIGPAG